MVSDPFGNKVERLCNRFQDPDVLNISLFLLPRPLSFLIVALRLLQILRQEAGEPGKGGAGGECSQFGGGRLLVLDPVLCHVPAGSPKAAQRWATVQDAACRRVPAHHVWQTSQVCITTLQIWPCILWLWWTFWWNYVFSQSFSHSDTPVIKLLQLCTASLCCQTYKAKTDLVTAKNILPYSGLHLNPRYIFCLVFCGVSRLKNYSEVCALLLRVSLKIRSVLAMISILVSLMCCACRAEAKNTTFQRRSLILLNIFPLMMSRFQHFSLGSIVWIFGNVDGHFISMQCGCAELCRIVPRGWIPYDDPQIFPLVSARGSHFCLWVKSLDNYIQTFMFPSSWI